MEEKFYVYFHVNPKTRVVFYVGKGHGRRAYTNVCRNLFWHRYVKKYGYDIVIVNNNLSEEEAIRLEMLYIKTIGRRDLKNGSLVNLTEGGEGTVGSKRTPEQLLAQSLRQKGRMLGNKHFNFGKKFSRERKDKMSIISYNCSKRGFDSRLSKDVLDINTGVFYGCLKEISDLYNINYQTLYNKVSLKLINTTQWFFSDDYEKDNYIQTKKDRIKCKQENLACVIKGNAIINSVIILDTQTGIFYHGIKQVAELLDRPIYWVRDRFNGRLKDVFNITNRYNIV